MALLSSTFPALGEANGMRSRQLSIRSKMSSALQFDIALMPRPARVSFQQKLPVTQPRYRSISSARETTGRPRVATPLIVGTNPNTLSCRSHAANTRSRSGLMIDGPMSRTGRATSIHANTGRRSPKPLVSGLRSAPSSFVATEFTRPDRRGSRFCRRNLSSLALG